MNKTVLMTLECEIDNAENAKKLLILDSAITNTRTRYVNENFPLTGNSTIILDKNGITTIKDIFLKSTKNLTLIINSSSNFDTKLLLVQDATINSISIKNTDTESADIEYVIAGD